MRFLTIIPFEAWIYLLILVICAIMFGWQSVIVATLFLVLLLLR